MSAANALPESAETQRLLTRLAHLSRDLQAEDEARHRTARMALLHRLWLAQGAERVAIACALCGHAPTRHPENDAPFALRLCSALPSDWKGVPAPTPSESELQIWMGTATRSALHRTLDAWKSAQPRQEASAVYCPELRREIRNCKDGLRLVRNLALGEAVEPCLRALRLFGEQERTLAQNPASSLALLADVESLLAEGGRALATMSVTALAPLWHAFAQTDTDGRNGLIAALPWLRSPEVIPALARLLELRTIWADGEKVGVGVVRAFANIGDLRVTPILRRLIGIPSVWRQPLFGERSSCNLVMEAQRALEIIEKGKYAHERRTLLRPAPPLPERGLLRPAQATSLPYERERCELLRPEENRVGEG